VPGRFFKYWLPLVLWMIIIFGASTNLGSSQNTSRFLRPFVRWLKPDISEQSLEKIHYTVRKTAHLTEYAIFAMLLWRAMRSEPKFKGTTIGTEFTRVLLLSALFAASDEFHQSFSNAREARVADVLIDTGGASLGAILFLGADRWRKRK
jgi:VanZ family protein